MSRMIQWLFVAGMILTFSGCATTYMGKVDAMGVGVGPKPDNMANLNYVDETQLRNVSVAYTPGIEIIEQENVGKTAKFVLGDALVKEYKGEPKLIVDWLNKYQQIGNFAMIIDKNGVIAWTGTLRSDDIRSSNGIEGYSLFGGKKFLTMDEAMDKYVGDGKEQDFEEEKVIEFKDEGLKGMFKGSKEGPWVYAKLPDFNVVTASGEEISISSIVNNGKPTLLVFFMSKGKEKADLEDTIETVQNVASILSGGEAREQAITPANALKNIDAQYLFVK